MTDVSKKAFLDLVAGRREHFQLESGHHGALWLDLDPLFAEPTRIAPFAAALANAIRAYDVDVVCGPLLGGAFLAQLVAPMLDAEFCYTERVMPAQPSGLYTARYVLPVALRRRVAGRRVAIVDDVMSAGSALRATAAELRSHGAQVVVAGSLLQLGDTGERHLRSQDVAVHAVARDEYALWLPKDCPLCAAREPLTQPGLAEGGDAAAAARDVAR